MAEAALLEPTDIAVDYEHLVTRLIRVMRASDEPLSLDDLAEMAGLSTYHFARVFRSVAGIPPGQVNAITCPLAWTPASVLPAPSTRMRRPPPMRASAASNSPWTVRRPGWTWKPANPVPSYSTRAT
jgi:hypothetical protein